MEALDITIESTAPEYVEEYADSELSSVSSATPSPLPSAIRRQSGRPRVGICNFDIAGKFTTNMKQHVKSAHPMFYKTIVEKEKQSKAKQMHKSETASKIMFTKQLTLPESLKSRKEYDRNSDIYKFLLRKLADFIGSTNTPNSLVENNEFRSLMCNCDVVVLDYTCYLPVLLLYCIIYLCIIVIVCALYFISFITP